LLSSLQQNQNEKATVATTVAFFTAIKPNKKQKEGAYLQVPTLACHFWL